MAGSARAIFSASSLSRRFCAAWPEALCGARVLPPTPASSAPMPAGSAATGGVATAAWWWGNPCARWSLTSVYMELNAALLIRALGMGEVTYLSDGVIDTIKHARSGITFERGWENWSDQVGRPYVPGTMEMGEGYSKSDT